MQSWFKKRRTQIAKSLPNKSVLILASLPEYFRQVGIKYPYRQESNFYYLTGFKDPNALFFLFPSGKSILFVSDADPLKEIWDGLFYEITKIKRQTLMDEVYPLSQWDQVVPGILKGKKFFFYDKLNPFFNKKLTVYKVKYSSAVEFLKKFRRIKDKREIRHIKKAIASSIYAHKQVAKALNPGSNERTLHGVFIKSIMEKGCDREAYGGIFACGGNATILHYTKNNAVCKKGELLLVDAGAEFNYYSSDITRVYPVSGKFSIHQKRLYESLLQLQMKLIKKVKPGVLLQDVNYDMYKGITEILLSLGFLKGTVDRHLERKSYQKYCPHFVGHLLGLDVHDVTFKKSEATELKPGMVLTIEPGIYISKQDTYAPKDLKGIGFRIEDDILVTKTGQINLSKDLPKNISSIEELCKS